MQLVSVVIPCYRQAHFLRESIESVQAQSYRNYEIIVVDDGSPDHPEEVVARYPEVKYLRQVNQGVSKARNRGFTESSGAYVVFLDADDRLLPNHLEAGVNSFRAFPYVRVVHGAYHWWKDEKRIFVHNCEFPYDQYEALLHKGMALGATMWSSDAVRKLGGFRNFIMGEDHDLQLRAAEWYPVHCHHELISEYRVYDKTLDWAGSLASIIRMFESHRDYIKGHPERIRYEALLDEHIEGYRTEVFGEPLRWHMGEAVRSGNILAALRDVGTLLRYHPRGLAAHLGGIVSRRVFCWTQKIAKLYAHRHSRPTAKGGSDEI